MARISIQVTLDKDEEKSVLEKIEEYLMYYSLLSNFTNEIPTIHSEICDNCDGTVELRVIDFECDLKEFLTLTEEATEDILKCMGIDSQSIIQDLYTDEDDSDGVKM